MKRIDATLVWGGRNKDGGGFLKLAYTEIPADQSHWRAGHGVAIVCPDDLARLIAERDLYRGSAEELAGAAEAMIAERDALRAALEAIRDDPHQTYDPHAPSVGSEMELRYRTGVEDDVQPPRRARLSHWSRMRGGQK